MDKVFSGVIKLKLSVIKVFRGVVFCFVGSGLVREEKALYFYSFRWKM